MSACASGGAVVGFASLLSFGSSFNLTLSAPEAFAWSTASCAAFSPGTTSAAFEPVRSPMKPMVTVPVTGVVSFVAVMPAHACFFDGLALAVGDPLVPGLAVLLLQAPAAISARPAAIV